MALERLQKILAKAGIASRRKAEELIVEGRVTVNGKLVRELGAKADPLMDRIEVSGRPILQPERKVHLLLNKPAGYVSTLSDPQGRPTIVDLIKEVKERVYPVGRLDFNSEGAILLTNDGALSHRLIHPRHHIPKTYRVKVHGLPDRKTIERLRAGVLLDDGLTLPAEVEITRRTNTNCWLEMTLFEGRNRQIRRMCQKVGFPVSRIIRVEFAGLSIGELKPGEYRQLAEGEVHHLRLVVGLE